MRSSKPSASWPAESPTQIRGQAERAAGLTRQLLAYARRQPLEPCIVNLNQLIRDATPLIQKAIGEQIEIKFALAPELQPTLADPSQLEQVLMNLCFNARDAMPEGGQLLVETKNVELDEMYTHRHEYAKAGHYIAMIVSDTGVGIPEAILDRIFEPFFTTKEVGRGTGLGLATTYGIVKQHDGLIEVYSELGKGSVFQVYLPASVMGQATAAEKNADRDAVSGGTETILVAEDHAGNLEMMDEILRKMGYTVILAKDGIEGIQKFRENQREIDLILLDVIMPRLGGPEAYERIRQINPDVPVIFTSGYSEESARLSAFISAGAGRLQKPFGPKTLAQKIREVLDRKRAEQKTSG